MPRDSAGNYTLAPGNPVISGTIISSSWANDTMADVAAALTDSLSRSGNGGMQVPMTFGDGTVGSPSISFVNGPSFGMWFDALNSKLSFSGGGSLGISIGSGGAVELNSNTSIGPVTGTEIGYLSGVTANIQDQLDATGTTITGAITTVVNNDLPINIAVISDGVGKIAASTVSATSLGYLTGVTSNIQNQLNNKSNLITGGATTIAFANLAASRALVSDTSGKVAVSGTSAASLDYLFGVTSNIQTQFNTINSQITAIGNDLTALYAEDATLGDRITSNDSDINTLNTLKAPKASPVFNGAAITQDTYNMVNNVWDASKGYYQTLTLNGNVSWAENINPGQSMVLYVTYVSGTYDFSFSVIQLAPVIALTSGYEYAYKLVNIAGIFYLTLLGTNDPAFWP